MGERLGCFFLSGEIRQLDFSLGETIEEHTFPDRAAGEGIDALLTQRRSQPMIEPARIHDAGLAVQGDVIGAGDARLLGELVKLDLDYRWRQVSRGGAAGPHLEEYLTRYPELGPAERLADTLIESEYVARRRWGDQPVHDEYARRFPGHEALLERLRAVDDDLAAEFAPRDPVLRAGAPALGTNLTAC